MVGAASLLSTTIGSRYAPNGEARSAYPGRMILAVAGLSVFMLSAGCGGDSTPGSAVLARSAAIDGIDVGPTSNFTGRIGGVPSGNRSHHYEISTDHNELHLASLGGGARVLSEGTTLAWFNEGALVWRVGGSGQGPQNFASIRGVCAVDSVTVLAYDGSNRRLVRAQRDTMPVVVISQLAGILVPHGCGPDGSFLFQTFTTPRQDGSGAVVSVLRLSPTGDVLDTLVVIPVPPLGTIGAENPSACALSNRLVVADPNAGTVRELSLDGSQLREWTWGEPRVPTSDESIAEFLGDTPASGSRPSEVAAFWESVKRRPRAPFWPAFEALLCDGAGEWGILQRYPGAGSTLSVFGNDGLHRAEVRLPKSTRDFRVAIVGWSHNRLALRVVDVTGFVSVGELDIE
jgi:hypothetical protein